MDYKNIEDNKVYKCMKCKELDMRENLVGNKKDGWIGTNEYECDSCGFKYRTETNPEIEMAELKREGIKLRLA